MLDDHDAMLDEVEAAVAPPQPSAGKRKREEEEEDDVRPPPSSRVVLSSEQKERYEEVHDCLVGDSIVLGDLSDAEALAVTYLYDGKKAELDALVARQGFPPRSARTFMAIVGIFRGAREVQSRAQRVETMRFALQYCDAASVAYGILYHISNRLGPEQQDEEWWTHQSKSLEILEATGPKFALDAIALVRRELPP